MSELSDEQFEEIKKEYKNDKIKIGVELNLARKLLISINEPITIIWCCSFTLIAIFSFVLCIFYYGLLGLLFAILFDALFFFYMGICSLSGLLKKIIYYISILGILIPFAFSLEIVIPLLLGFLCFISVYLFYFYVGYKTVHKIALKDKETFLSLLENGVIIVDFSNETE